MRLRVLGTAAGGGVPQWNCTCPGCAAARTRPDLRRAHASLAVQTGAGRWLVINATPDIAAQIESCPELRPGPGHRRTPVAAVILTDAELDHTLGLLRLREARSLQVVAPPAVLRALSGGLRLDGVLAAYTGLTWRELTEDRPLRLGDLEVRGIAMSDKRPRYARDVDHAGPWVTALRITDRSAGTTVVYAPCLADWPERLDDALRDADCVFADGTFWDDEEPRRSGISGGTARQMGHLPITETAARLAAAPAARRFYTHLNNTNPLIDPDAPQHRTLAGMGIEVAREKALIEL